jgi:hypothetical protein
VSKKTLGTRGGDANKLKLNKKPAKPKKVECSRDDGDADAESLLSKPKDHDTFQRFCLVFFPSLFG